MSWLEYTARELLRAIAWRAADRLVEHAERRLAAGGAPAAQACAPGELCGLLCGMCGRAMRRVARLVSCTGCGNEEEA